jgi:hypothetical protein
MITPSFGLTATERVLPRLTLDFTTASLDPRVTFTRTGNTATVVNSSGNIALINADLPRFDYNPITLVCKGLLIEELRTNLSLYSSDYSNAVWGGKTGLSLTTGQSSPDGATNATLLTSTSNGTRFIGQTYTTVAATDYVASFFVKADTTNFVAVSIVDGANQGMWAFNVSTGVVGQNVISTLASTSGIEPYGAGYYRCWVKATATTTTLASRCIPSNGINSGASTAGNAVYVYGAQFEAGAFATSYIPTTATALPRNADVATITGTNFSDFWQASKGGASVIATPSTVSGIRPLVQYDDGTADNLIALRGNAANPELQIVDGGAPQVQLDAGTIVANTPYSLTGWWQTNDCKARQNSGATVSDYTATIPTVTQARIGSDGTNYLNGTIATINYYDSFFGQPIYTRRKNKVFPSLL